MYANSLLAYIISNRESLLVIGNEISQMNINIFYHDTMVPRGLKIIWPNDKYHIFWKYFINNKFGKKVWFVNFCGHLILFDWNVWLMQHKTEHHSKW